MSWFWGLKAKEIEGRDCEAQIWGRLLKRDRTLELKLKLLALTCPGLPISLLLSHTGGLGPRVPGASPRETAELGTEQSWTAVWGATACSQESSFGSWSCTAHCRLSPR